MTRTELCAAGWLSTTIVISHTVKHTPVPILSFMLMLMMILTPLRPYAIIMLVVVILMIMIVMKMASGGESHAGNTVVGILRAMATASTQLPGLRSFPRRTWDVDDIRRRFLYNNRLSPTTLLQLRMC